MKVGTGMKSDPRMKQKENWLVIAGADVCQLFPSLKNLKSARMARCAILCSKADFCGWDYLKALRYLYIVGGSKFLKKIGLGRIAPKWLGNCDDLLTVGGSKSKGDTDWKDTEREIFETKKRKFIEAAVKVVFSTHVYQFGGKYYLQREGEPTGLGMKI